MSRFVKLTVSFIEQLSRIHCRWNFRTFVFSFITTTAELDSYHHLTLVECTISKAVHAIPVPETIPAEQACPILFVCFALNVTADHALFCFKPR